MSGGSHNYVYCNIENELCGQMKDRELNDMMADIATLAHDLEWMESGDSSKYPDTVKAFKEKWFKGDRSERLKSYIDDSIEELRKELYAMLGV